MRRLCAELGNPERSYRSLHVVGTNGKGSVTLACVAFLEAAGVRTGACVSPHLWEWRERTRIGGETIAQGEFARAVETVSGAVARLERSWAEEEPADGPGEPERITQFEAAIAASLLAFREAGVEVAVVEAGLGGRLDATNVIASEATALSSVSLDHTDWLGDTVEEIAAEKLAVLERGTVLVTGRLEPAVAELARAHAERLGAELRVARELPAGAGAGRLPPYQRRNAGVALELASVIARPTREQAGAAVAGLRLPGRGELIEGDPPVLADAAHNAEGARALAEALDDLAPDRARVGCLAVLADKDAAAIAAALAPALDRVICTEAEPGPAMGRPGARPRDAHELAAEFGRRGVQADVVDQPCAAIERARRLAAEREGVAVCAGSHYLLRCLWTAKRDQSSST